MTDVLKCMRKFKKLILVCLFLVLPVLYLNSADIVYAVDIEPLRMRLSRLILKLKRRCMIVKQHTMLILLQQLM